MQSTLPLGMKLRELNTDKEHLRWVTTEKSAGRSIRLVSGKKLCWTKYTEIYVKKQLIFTWRL